MNSASWTFPFLALIVLLGCHPDPPQPFNLLLISLDTVTPARMSAYGAERETTPAIRALASRGVRFDNAFSTSSWTLPSHASMLTGRYPSSLAPDPNDKRLYRVTTLLAELFQAKGYQTSAVTGGNFVGAEFGANRGFDRFRKGKIALAIEWLENRSAPDRGDTADDGDGFREPFFFFFHTYIAHMPYKDRRFAKGMDGGRLEDIYKVKSHPIHRQVCCTGIELTPAEQEFLLALYDGGVAAADEMVGRLVETLSGMGELERTVIVITSDHGEEFWQHTGRAAFHGHTLYDELLRIPLVWFDPALKSRGEVVDDAVSLVDLVPTFATRFGLERPSELDGVDLTPLLHGDDWDVERAIFSEGVRERTNRMSVRTAQGKLIVIPKPKELRRKRRPKFFRLSDPIELFLPDDPDERVNVAATEPELLASLQALLDAHRESAASEEPDMPIEPIDEGLREQLRALGYTE